MSFSCRLEVGKCPGPEVDIDAHEEEIINAMNESGMDPDSDFSNMCEAFDDGEAEFSCMAADLLSVVQEIARLHPEAHFRCRACGEEFSDTWVGEFKNGTTSFLQGPRED